MAEQGRGDYLRQRMSARGSSRPMSRPSAPVRPQRLPNHSPTSSPPQTPPSPQPVRPQPARPVAPPEPVAARESVVAVERLPLPKSKKRGKRSKKPLFILLVLLFLAGLGSGAYAAYKKYAQKPVANQNQAPRAQSAPEQPKATGTIRLIATGSNLASESLNNAAKKPDGSYDYLPMMADMKPFFDKADIRLCNQTTPAGGDKNGLALSGYPTFNGPLEWSTGFSALGCNVISLASEHINDKDQPAIDGTLKILKEQKNILAVAGANQSAEEQAKIQYFTVKEVKFAYLAYTTTSAIRPANGFAVNMYSDDLANKQIAEARKNAQLVIVSMNWGTEGNADISADQDRIATNLANQNVDVVVGVGPHVLQPAKILDGKDGHQTLVWFSLGNFLNTELPVDNLIGGMAIMDFDVATQQLSNPKLMPVYMHYEWSAQQKAAGTVNARKGFKIMPLDVAAPALAKSQNKTTVEAQTSRVTALITKFAPIKVIKSTEF